MVFHSVIKWSQTLRTELVATDNELKRAQLISLKKNLRGKSGRR